MNVLAKNVLIRLFSSIALGTVLLPHAAADAQNGLAVTYGSKGIQTLSYGGVVLEDQGTNGSDVFHIWHMKSTDLSGNVISYGQYGWGESNNGESWDPFSQTETYTFSWGSISTQFVQSGDNLNMIVTETNNADSGILFDGAEVYPFALHFPVEPSGFYGYSQYAITTTGPAVSMADYGSGVVTSVVPNEAVAMYGGWKAAGGATYTPLMTSTAPDGLATFLPRNDMPVQPGSSFTYTVSLRFTPEGKTADASDAYASFAATYPSQMTWSDRRIIGTAYLASSPSNPDITQPGGFPTNPRRYFNDSSVDITTGAGLQAFQARMLAQAQSNVNNTQGMSGQGVITWDIEGEQYPQSTSYVCSPDQIAAVAPEMESVISDPSSPYYGQKLDDAYFKTMTDAGLKVGVCLRPQVFALGANGTANQSYLSANAAIIQSLEAKAQYANSRWGVTLFYVDSTVDVNGGTLDPAIFQQLITDMPKVLFIPEESTPRYYAYSAPFYSFLFHGDLGTPSSIYKIYPKAFGANLINDVSASALAANIGPLTQAVANGDILMGHADYWQDNDPVLVSIYAAAGAGTQQPVQSMPAITWNPVTLSYGMPLSGAQLNASANVAGTFVYKPAAGSILPAGNATLSATFTPTDTADYKTITTSAVLMVKQAVPVVRWAVPAAITAGTALSAKQLNATANVAGSFSYNPGIGTVLSAGSHTLKVIFQPADPSDYAVVSASTTLVVKATQKITPTITWPVPASIRYGTALSSTQLNATASTAGTFAYTPGTRAILNAGSNTLQVTFTPSNSAKYSSAKASTTLYVAKAKPVLTWPAPAALTSGTALTDAQLDATANVSGSFTYNPPAGSVPNVGVSTLQAMFTPGDSTNYTTQTITVPLTVNAPPANVYLAITWPTAGASVSGVIDVAGYVNLFLDSAGTFLILDGQEVGTQRVTNPPFLYPLDTTTLTNGTHVLQLWGHDISNNTTVSQPVSITVAN